MDSKSHTTLGKLAGCLRQCLQQVLREITALPPTAGTLQVSAPLHSAWSPWCWRSPPSPELGSRLAGCHSSFPCFQAQCLTCSEQCHACHGVITVLFSMVTQLSHGNSHATQATVASEDTPRQAKLESPEEKGLQNQEERALVAVGKLD